jgi:hypothetical protein
VNPIGLDLALKAKGAFGHDVRFVRPPPWKVNRPGAGPVSKAVRARLGMEIVTSAFRWVIQQSRSRT